MRSLGFRELQLCLLRVGYSRARVSKALSSGETAKHIFGRAGGAESQTSAEILCRRAQIDVSVMGTLPFCQLSRKATQ